MRWLVLCASAMLAVSSCAIRSQAPAAGAAAPAPQLAPAPGPVLASGVDGAYIDRSVRPQDDVYRYLNGKWLDTFELPVDKGTYGTIAAIADRTELQLRSLVTDLAAAPTQPGSDAQKIADLYASFMDVARLEGLGLAPLRPQFAAIDAVTTKQGIPALIAHLNRIGAGAPYDLGIGQDPKDSTRYAVIIGQSGLGLPDRDYYLKDDAKLKDVRVKYLAHVEKMLRMAGLTQARRHAADIVKLETALAQLQWTRVENRDPVKTYNKTSIAELATLTPGYDWRNYLSDSGIYGKVDYVVIRQPSYFSGLAKLIATTPLPVWKSYFKWQVLSAAAPYLSQAFVAERFAFGGTALRGIPENRPRWKRGIALTDESLGEALGKLYVEKYFPPANKARAQRLVANLLEAYRLDIDKLEWMSPETKRGAQAKLAKLVTKIGYPDTWRDYGSLRIVRDDLWGNVLRATAFEYQHDIDKLGKPIDRDEWHMTPQTVNAYYNPPMNEIVFPAAILQPPLFDVQADDAVNYGGIGAVIGHEISHGFDDQGSQFDADGNLHDWFTHEDHEKFAAKTRALVAQYARYEPVAGFHVNGELTLGENIADNAGLAIAYQAYRLSLGGAVAPVIDGMSGEQRFYFGWVQVWRGKTRESEAIQRVKTDPHSPVAVRGRAPLVNQPGFYAAFGVKEGDAMYLAPAQRVGIW
jgi:putative endopeptidase